MLSVFLGFCVFGTIKEKANARFVLHFSELYQPFRMEYYMAKSRHKNY